MKSYSVPAMCFQNEFVDLGFLAGYVDALLASSNDQDYRIVFEWGSAGPGDYPPRKAWRRIPDGWEELAVVVDCIRQPDNSYRQTFTINEYEAA
jgi:hypothetical protein